MNHSPESLWDFGNTEGFSVFYKKGIFLKSVTTKIRNCCLYSFGSFVKKLKSRIVV